MSHQHPIALKRIIARARASTKIAHPHQRIQRRISMANARVAQEQSGYRDYWESLSVNEKKYLPKPYGPLKTVFEAVTDVRLGGGGGSGRALPAAMKEAVEFGLDPNKLEKICATSVGTIVGLSLTLNIDVSRFSGILAQMPADKFQDWDLESVRSAHRRWGVCEGKAMPAYFRQLIKDETGLNDPTFKELYEAGYKKEFRVVTANVSRGKIAIFSHLLTPMAKVADIVALACSVPLVFPPRWIPNKEGVLEAYTDGGILKNYPWGVGDQHQAPLEQQLGFVFVTEGAANALNRFRGQSELRFFWDYFVQILTLIAFQDPLCISEGAKARTVAITTEHNPLKFTATLAEQRKLDRAGKIGVRRLVRYILKKKSEEPCHAHNVTDPFMPQFEMHQRRNALNASQPTRGGLHEEGLCYTAPFEEADHERKCRS